MRGAVLLDRIDLEHVVIGAGRYLVRATVAGHAALGEVARRGQRARAPSEPVVRALEQREVRAFAERQPERIRRALHRAIHAAPAWDPSPHTRLRQTHRMDGLERAERGLHQRRVAAHERPGRVRRRNQRLARDRQTERALDPGQPKVAEARRVQLVLVRDLGGTGDGQARAWRTSRTGARSSRPRRCGDARAAQTRSGCRGTTPDRSGPPCTRRSRPRWSRGCARGSPPALAARARKGTRQRGQVPRRYGYGSGVGERLPSMQPAREPCCRDSAISVTWAKFCRCFYSAHLAPLQTEATDRRPVLSPSCAGSRPSSGACGDDERLRSSSYAS